jgi:hypothetical protein
MSLANRDLELIALLLQCTQGRFGLLQATLFLRTHDLMSREWIRLRLQSSKRNPLHLFTLRIRL